MVLNSNTVENKETTELLRRVNVTLLGKDLDKEKSEAFLQQRGCIKYRDAYQLKSVTGELWLFEYAVLVSWGVDENERKQTVEELEALIIDKHTTQPIEQFGFKIGGDTLQVKNDLLLLPVDDPMIRLALSHALAQSSKLSAFEDKAVDVIEKNAYLSKELARTGKIPLSRKQLSMLRGVLFETSSDISLHFNLLDTPDFFWDNPELEEPYQKLAKYLELTPRIELLNHKLATIQSLVDVLAAEQNHKHSAFLEWIIIILIAVDIVIYFF